MEFTIPTYQGVTQVNPNLSSAIKKSKESDSYNIIKAIAKQSGSIESVELDSTLKSLSIIDSQLTSKIGSGGGSGDSKTSAEKELDKFYDKEEKDSLKAEEDAVKELEKLKEKQDKAKLKQEEFLNKSTGRLESQELDASIGNMSNADKATTIQKKIQENIEAVAKGEMSQDYAESFNNSLYEKYGKYADDAIKDHNIDTVNSQSEIYSTLKDNDKASLLNHLQEQGYSKDVIEGVSIGGSVKQLLKETANKETMTSSEADFIKSFTLDIKNKIAETGKDPESTPQIKSWLFQLDNIAKDLEDRTVKGAQLNLVKDIGNKGDLSSAYMVNKTLEDFQLANPKNPSKAYTDFEKFQLEKENYDKARDMANNPDKYTQSEKDQMYKDNKAYKGYIAPAVSKSYINAMKNGDFSGANQITLTNPTIIKEEIGKNITNVLNSLVNVSKDAPEIVSSKQEALKQQVNIFESQRSSTNGVAATKALYGENYETMKNISNISTHLTGGDVLKAFNMNDQVLQKGLNKNIEPKLQSKIYEKLNNEPARDEIWDSLYVLNTVGSSALNESTVNKVIDKYHSGDIKTNNGIIIRSDGHPIDSALSGSIDKYVSSTYPDATKIIQKGNYMNVYSDSGIMAQIPVSVWKQNEKIWSESVLDISKLKGQTAMSKNLKIGTTVIAKGYERASKMGDDNLKNLGTDILNGISNYILEGRMQLYIDASKDTSLSSTTRESMLLEAKKIKDKMYINNL